MRPVAVPTFHLSCIGVGSCVGNEDATSGLSTLTLRTCEEEDLTAA